MNPTPRQLRFVYIVYATALIVLAFAHMAHAQKLNPYVNEEGFSSGVFSTRTPTSANCVQIYSTYWQCPNSERPASVTPPAPVSTPTTTSQDQMPMPESRTLMFGNALVGSSIPGQTQDYVPFLNLANGWQPQAYLVTVVTSDGSWQQTYDMPAWRHRSINLQDCPLLVNKVTGFAVFVQVWGVGTATVSLHRASDPWGAAYQTIQPDAMATPSRITATP